MSNVKTQALLVFNILGEYFIAHVGMCEISLWVEWWFACLEGMADLSTSAGKLSRRGTTESLAAQLVS